MMQKKQKNSNIVQNHNQITHREDYSMIEATPIDLTVITLLKLQGVL